MDKKKKMKFVVKPKKEKKKVTAVDNPKIIKNVTLKVKAKQSVESSKYPVFYLSYVDERIKKEGELALPDGYLRSVNRTLNMGYTIEKTQLSRDHVVISDKNNYKKKIQEYITTKKPVLAKGAKVIWAKHAPYRHFRDFVYPAMKKALDNNKSLKGVFLAEADLYIYDGYNFDWFISNYNNYNDNVWLAWKKILSNYIVGNFFLYFSREGFKKLEKFIINKGSKDMLSDRFFYQLHKLGDLELNKINKDNKASIKPVRIGDEIEHFSKVAGGIRKSGVK